jgi:hypothetical protein
MTAPEMGLCPMTSCKVCTACAHSRHNECRHTVQCPTDGVVRVCSCCGVTGVFPAEVAR